MIATMIAVIFAAYFLGSIPSAYIIGRLLKDIDMREVGDGRIGAAAAFRNLGIAGGMMVGFVDFSKGALAVALALTTDVPLIVTLLCGIMAIVGHNWPVFLGFKGGRGAATTYGVLASLMLWQFLIALVSLTTSFDPLVFM